MDHTGSIIR